MVQQYGLGRGLASLIPPKKSSQGARLPASPSLGGPDGQGSASGGKIGDAVEASPFHVPALPTFHQGGTVPQTTAFSSDFVSASPSASNQPSQDAPIQNNSNGMMEAAIEKIVSNPHQPRLHFDETKLAELAVSIKEHGILQPLIVSRIGENYELIAGERRFQAAKRIGLRTVPVVVRSVTEQEKLELAIIENIQRHDLNPIEEAKAYLRLLDEFNMQQEAVAKKMGKSRSAVANTLRLLHLPIEIQRAVAEGTISEGHAKALLAIENPEKQRAVFDLIIKEELTVRETELKVRSISVKSHVRSAVPINAKTLERMEHLTQIFGTKVRIVPLGKGGKIMIEYYSSEDLDGLLKRLEE